MDNQIKIPDHHDVIKYITILDPQAFALLSDNLPFMCAEMAKAVCDLADSRERRIATLGVYIDVSKSELYGGRRENHGYTIISKDWGLTDTRYEFYSHWGYFYNIAVTKEHIAGVLLHDLNMRFGQWPSYKYIPNLKAYDSAFVGRESIPGFGVKQLP